MTHHLAVGSRGSAHCAQKQDGPGRSIPPPRLDSLAPPCVRRRRGSGRIIFRMPGAQPPRPERAGASTTEGTGPSRTPRSLLPALPVVAVLLGAAAIVLSTMAEGPP